MDNLQKFVGLLTGEFDSISINGKDMSVKRADKLTVCYDGKEYDVPELKDFNEMWDDVKNCFGV